MTDPQVTEIRIRLRDGATLSAATMPELAITWARHVMGAGWWDEAHGMERLGAASAMFQELSRALDARHSDDQDSAVGNQSEV